MVARTPGRHPRVGRESYEGSKWMNGFKKIGRHPQDADMSKYGVPPTRFHAGSKTADEKRAAQCPSTPITGLG